MARGGGAAPVCAEATGTARALRSDDFPAKEGQLSGELGGGFMLQRWRVQ